MSKTRRRNPHAKELEKPQYRGKRIKDKRKQKLEEMAGSGCAICKQWVCECPITRDNPLDWIWVCNQCKLDTGKCKCHDEDAIKDKDQSSSVPGSTRV